MERIYKVSYHDDEAEGNPVIKASHPINENEAKEVITEQLRENGINEGEVVIDSFEEVTNPILKFFL